MIFERLAYLEGSHSTNDETKRQFQKILIMQFINIAVVILIVNINLFENGLLGFPVFAGDYDDLNSDWYAQVGKTISFTLFLNIFTPHASKLFWPMLKACRRCKDRGCSSNLANKEGNNIEVNSQCVL